MHGLGAARVGFFGQFMFFWSPRSLEPVGETPREPHGHMSYSLNSIKGLI